MSFTRSALLACLVAAAFGCKRHKEEPAKRSETTPKPTETTRPETKGSESMQPKGGAAPGGVQGRTPESRTRSGGDTREQSDPPDGGPMTNESSDTQESPTDQGTSDTSPNSDQQ